MTYHLLTAEEKEEVFVDRTEAFLNGYISEKIFRREMADIGKNATDIEDLVKQFRPPAPENEDGDFG